MAMDLLIIARCKINTRKGS